MSLLAASKNLDDADNRRALWKAYSFAKQAHPSLLQYIPDRAWDLLWETQSAITPANPNCMEHQIQLVQDMKSIGRPPTVAQNIAELEATFMTGEHETAIQRWEEEYNTRTAKSAHGYKPEYLDLGVRMYALTGNAQRAREVMDELYQAYPGSDPRLMIGVVRAHTRIQYVPDYIWSLYVRLKDRLGPAMTFEDYDTCFVGFLEGSRVDHAVAVFKDMVSIGCLARSFMRWQVQQTLKRLRAMLNVSKSLEEANMVALSAISVLPRAYHNHIFRRWMMLTVAKNSPESAAQLLELMFERGLNPGALHFNLVIGALLRSGTETNGEKAALMGWKMVEEALNTSSLQDTEFQQFYRMQHKPVPKQTGDLDGPLIPFFLARPIPMADVTTFAHLIRHHTRNWEWNHIEYLQTALVRLEKPPIAPLLNALMMVDLRRVKYQEVWNRFDSMTHPPLGFPRVVPNGGTYRVLWKTLRSALGDHHTWDFESLPQPRQLMAMMVEWWTEHVGWHQTENYLRGLTGPNREITGLIQHCFSYTKDVAGALVALHALKTRFGIFPTQQTAEILVKQMAWIDLRSETKEVRYSYKTSGVFIRNVDKISRVYQVLLRRRLEQLEKTGVNLIEMTKQERGELDLNLLSEFVRVVMVRQHSATEVENMIEEAKKDMGVPNISTGDLNSFEVS
ncbi:uncharacterized protein BDZ99DRAFT_479230 [Mytilinidion resinicola]|uniref:Pentatricopeptide repeat protein n=1 Tax=Mytilinidion resinicola TaxID=574789 RepID=A0A6A6YG33_9PEZI|nr:uncharacterized protein BDZ99DRAFT_479230 [Mytilinidion resinicola]KAF2806847.1 hypothetical protein BDZ99DRAFT_479230 [Mytilinidion resinicola]